MDIHHLVLTGQTDRLVEELNRNPSRLNERDKQFGMTPLHWSCDKGNSEIVSVLVSVFRADMEAKSGGDEETPLYKCIHHGHVQLLEYLLKKGASMTATDVNGWTPLHCACADGQVECVRTLVAHGANLEAGDLDGWTPLHVACDLYEGAGHEDILMLLAEHGANGESRDERGETALHRACTKGVAPVVKLLLLMGASAVMPDDDGWHALHKAAAKGHSEVINTLVRHSGPGHPSVVAVDVNCQDKNGWTPLHRACLHRQLAAINTLIVDHKASVKMATFDGSNCVYIAAGKGFADVINILVSHGAPVNSRVGDDGLAPLHIAAVRGHGEVVSLLLSSLHQPPDALDANGLTALHRVAAKGTTTTATTGATGTATASTLTPVEMLELLLSLGASVHARAPLGSNALDFAKDNNDDDNNTSANIAFLEEYMQSHPA